MTTYLFLKWAHIIAMAYWLGGEWGVFNASRPITNATLSLEERTRHMETAYRIDILPRTGIILLLPLGLHMGAIGGYQPLTGSWITGMWIAVAAWLSITYSAYFKRGTDIGLTLTKMDEAIRYVVIPLLIGFAIYSLLTRWPFPQGWYAAKVGLYGVALIIGLILRFIMRDWVIQFRKLTAGPDPEAEAKLDKRLAFGRGIAYVYWIVIGTVALFGVFKGAVLL